MTTHDSCPWLFFLSHPISKLNVYSILEFLVDSVLIRVCCSDTLKHWSKKWHIETLATGLVLYLWASVTEVKRLQVCTTGQWSNHFCAVKGAGWFRHCCTDKLEIRWGPEGITCSPWWWGFLTPIAYPCPGIWDSLRKCHSCALVGNKQTNWLFSQSSRCHFIL